MARHYIIVNSEDKALQFPLKQWVRQNLNDLPDGFDPSTQTTSQIRGRLRQLKWQIWHGENEVFIIRPDNNGDFSYAEEIIEDFEDEFEDIHQNEQVQELKFSLEKDLQSALRKNISFLEQGLIICDGGRERHTAAGRVDITAKDSNNNTVVIELKAIEAKSDVIAQTLSYMEAVSKEDNCNVRGIIIASGFQERVKLAARQIPSLRLVEYNFQFTFNSIV